MLSLNIEAPDATEPSDGTNAALRAVAELYRSTTRRIFMRPLRLIIAALLTATASFATDNTSTNLPAPKVRSRGEPAEGKVLRVFAADDEGARFRAYVVKWKDSEVVVSDILARSDFKDGQVIRFSAVRTQLPDGATALAFEIVPPGGRVIPYTR